MIVSILLRRAVAVLVAATSAATAYTLPHGSGWNFSEPLAVTRNGTLHGGKCAATGVHFFKGIPYAQPPVGDLRLAPPAIHDTAYGHRNATAPSPACVQFGLAFLETEAQSEDCLFIDIYTPANAGPWNPYLPVKVWIYGGSNQAGGISSPLYDGCNSATDSVLVLVNYRLGPLGFLSLESAGLSGNYAIQDQLLALRWVQENIHAFGGDRRKVLLYGESAGAHNTWALATMTEAPRLMSAAAMESGGGIEFATVAQTEQWSQIYVGLLNCNSTDIVCLKAIPYTKYQSALLGLPGGVNPPTGSLFAHYGAGWSSSPVIDGKIIPVRPLDAGLKVPVLFGTTTAETALFVWGGYAANFTILTQADYDNFLYYNFGPLAGVVNDTYPVAGYPASPGQVYNAMAEVSKLSLFTCPQHRGLKAAARNGMPTYTYFWNATPSCDWISPILGWGSLPISLLGPTHTAELPFVFGNMGGLPLPSGNCSLGDTEKKTSAFIRAAWTNLAANRSPGWGWPAWTATRSQGIVFNEDGPQAGLVDYSACDFWDELTEEIAALRQSGYYSLG